MVKPARQAAADGVVVAHVLVPLDGSEFALQALPTARALAEHLTAELHTISVAGGAADAERLQALGAAALGVGIGDRHVLVVVDDGEVAELIVERAEHLGSCVVCMTTHGRGRLHGAIVGSVARSVLQRSASPLVVLGPMADNPGWSPRPRRWPEPLAVKRVVACVDGSAASEEVLPIAVEWARALDMSMTILTVTDDSIPLDRQRHPGGSFPADAHGYVERLAQQCRSTFTEVQGQVLRDPIGPASAIRIHLDKEPAGLVALATHARSGFERLRLGAVAASIVHASSAPCLVVPTST